MSGKIKDYSALVDRYEARIAANPSRESVLQAKLDSKIAAQIAKGNTVKIDGATVTSYDLVSSSGGGSSGGGTTGSTFTLTTGSTDLIPGTSSADSVAGLVSATASKTTYNTGDAIIDSKSGDGDVLTITAEDDVAGVPIVKGIEKVQVNLNAVTTTTGTSFAFAATNIDATTLNFDNVASKTAVNGVSVTGLKSGSVVQSSDDFSTIKVATSAATDSITVEASAKGSTAQPTDITIDGAAKNATIKATGTAKVTAADMTGLLDITAAGAVTIANATKAVAVVVNNTAGSVTLTDADSASLVRVTATGNITSAAAALKAVSTLELNAGSTVSATIATGGTLKAATLAGSGASNTFTDTDGTVVSLSVSGNGGAATYTIGDSTTKVLNNVNISGTQNVTITMRGANIDALTTTTGYEGTADALAIVDTSSGTSTLKIATSAGNANLSKSVGLDVVNLAFDNATKTITLPTSATLTVSAAQDGATTISGASATKTTNSLAIKLDDGTRDGNAADFQDAGGAAGELALTNLKTVTIDASVDTAADGTSNKHQFFKITGTDQNANVTINGGVNALDIAAAANGAVSLGVGTLTLTGSGAVAITHATGTLSAAALDASAVSGKVTAVGVVLGSVPVVKTGSNDDSITLITAAGDVNSTIESGSGNDTVTLFGGDYGDYNRTFNLGEGSADKLVVSASTVLAANTGKSITISGVETLEIAGASTIAASLLTGQTYKVQADGAGKSYAVGVEVGTGTTIDLSTLVETTETAKTVAALVFTTDASAKTTGYNITGLSDAKNVIKGAAGYTNTLVGGSKADTLHAGGIQDILTGGSGNDVFDVSNAEVKGGSATKFVTITDFAVNPDTSVGDRINVVGTGVVATATELDGGTGTWTLHATNGMATKVGASLSDFVTAVKDWVTLAIDVTDSPDNALVGFVSGGSTYIYHVNSAADTTDDVLIKLTGVVATGLEATAATAGYVTIA